MKKIAFVTSTEDRDLTSDDRLAIPFLEKLGISVEPLVWDEPHDPSRFDIFIFRSCWNYHRQFWHFQSWLNLLRALRKNVFNSLDVIEWNLNKKHILDLKVPIPKTAFFEMGSQVSIQDVALLPHTQIVLKPAVSLNGHDTYLMNDPVLIFEKLSELLKTRDMLIQEYLPEIKTSGEVSLVFFDKVFSHALRKTAAPNEFRIHAEYGGTRTSIDASRESLSYAQKILMDMPERLLYARVDLVETVRGPMLIELELTDPMLYLASDPNAPRRFADAVAAYCLTPHP